MKKKMILIPVDGSDFARQIFPYITQYIHPEENELTLIRVEDPHPGHVGAPTKPASAESRVQVYERRGDLIEAKHPIYASQEWDSATAEIQRTLQHDVRLLEMAGFTVTVAVRFDERPGDAIVRYIETHDIDMIAMTTHGRTGFNRLIFGSVAHYLAKHLSIPILVVRPTEE